MSVHFNSPGIKAPLGRRKDPLHGEKIAARKRKPSLDEEGGSAVEGGVLYTCTLQARKEEVDSADGVDPPG